MQLSHVPDLFPLEQRLTAWNVIIPAPTVLNQSDTWPPWLFPWMDKWFSIGPYHMTHPEFEGYHDSSDPWGGRMTCLAFHPILNNPPLVYAGCINGGGIWQSQGSGDSWVPIGDQLSSMKISALAVDPEHPQIIYAAAGYWKATDPFPLSFKETTGPIFKSVNGEWKLFAAPAQGYSKLEVRQLPSGHTVIYAASNRGLLRYKTINWWETSAGGTWENIMPGAKIADMVVHPTNPDIVYAVPYVTVYKSGVAFEVPDGIWRTSSGTTMTPSPLWGIGWKFRSPISNDMTALVNRTGSQLHLDLFRANPNKVYASLLKPPTDSCKSCGHVELFYSNNEGQSWTFSISNTYYQGGDPNLAATFSWTDNSFLRSHPTREDWLYYGYVYLWRTYKDGTGQWQNQLVSDIHPDVHDLKFHPKDEYFYLAGDGGVYRGAVGELTSEEGWTYVYEVFQGLNNDLRNAQVYDFDVSQTNPDVMLAGTQDEGTIEYTAPTYPGQTPSWKWRCIRGGDGMYSLIAPSDNSIFYSQYVSGIDSTKISQGGWGGWGSRPHNNLVKTDSNGSLTWGNQYITVDPFDPYHVLAQGPQVQETTDDMYHWTQAGPPAIGLAPDWTQVVRQGNIRRVIFNPTIPGTWFAGTDKGGQIWEKVPNFFLGDWRCVFQHPEPNARVVSMAFAPNNPDILYVAFDNVDIFKGFFRLLRLQRGVEGNWKPYWIAWDLPREHLPLKKDLEVKCLVGDPQDDRVAYLATDKGIFKGKTSNADSPAMWTWKPYNEGLPLVEVTKLIPLKNEPQMRASTYGRGLWAVWLRPPAMND